MLILTLWIAIFLPGSMQFGFDLRILEQSKLYLENIHDEKNAQLAHWSLSKLYSGTCSQNNIVMRSIADSRDPELIRLYSTYRCGDKKQDNVEADLARIRHLSIDQGYQSTGIYYLFNNRLESERTQFIQEFVNEWGIDNSETLVAIGNFLTESTPINIEILSKQEKLLFFYSILFDGTEGSTIHSLLDRKEQQELLQEWIDRYTITSDAPTVERSILFANMIRLAFEINALPTIQSLYQQKPELDYFPLGEEKTRYLNAASYALYVIGRFDEALKLLRGELIPIADYLELSDILEEATFSKGVSLYSIGKFQEARTIFEEIYYKEDSVIDKTELFNNLSICYLKLGEKNKYVEYQLSALDQATEEGEYKKQLIILRNLFVFYTSLRNGSTAQYYLDMAEDIALRQNDTYELAAIHSFSGTFQWEFNKDADKALSELRIAQQQYNVDRDYFDYVTAKNEEARILVSIDSLERAQIVYQNMADLATERSNTVDYLEAQMGLADIYIKMDDLDTATLIFEDIRSYPTSDLDFEASVKYKTILSEMLHKKGQIRRAQDMLSPVTEQITQRARNSIDSQSGSWTIQPEYVAAFNLYLDILLNQGSNARAIQVLDNLKTINDAALYNSPLLRSQQLSEEELARDKLLSERIQVLRNNYLNASGLSQEFDIKRQIDQLSARREEILNRVRSRIQIKDVDIRAIQRILDKDEAVIHYSEVGEQMYASLITSREIEIRILRFDKEMKIKFRDTADLLASSATDLLKLRELYNHLELEQMLPEGINKMIVIPDNVLYRIPMGVFPVSVPHSETSYGTTRYLIEDKVIEYYTSLNALIQNHRISSAEKQGFSAYAISDFSDFESNRLSSLPYTIQEVNEINNLLENVPERSLYLGNEATKNSFLDGIQNSSIVHVATHSEVSEQDPLFSTVYLNDPKEPSRALYAYELFDVSINSNLIMMNSCSSGSGGYLQGAGILGLSRVLRYAGAKSLGLNIWSVNDKSASDFATNFYRYVGQGESKSVSMHQSKLDLLYSANANPYYWGAFILIGNPEPLTKKPEKTGFLYLFLISIIWGGIIIALRD